MPSAAACIAVHYRYLSFLSKVPVHGEAPMTFLFFSCHVHFSSVSPFVHHAGRSGTAELKYWGAD